jgi:hypothetical protein
MLPNQIPAADPEIVAVGSAISDVITALKSHQNALQAGEAALPDLLAASTSLQNAAVDIKKPANQAYLAWAIAQALEPKP